MASMHVDDFGGTITATVTDRGTVKDISAATLVQFIIKSASGTETTITAAFVTDGTNGKAYVTIPSGLFDAQGRYKVQVIVTFSTTSKFHSDWMEFVVKPNL